MTDTPDEDVAAVLADLVDTLQELETTVEPRTKSGRPRPPSPRELLRFTSDVTIPAAILVLKTNIEALKLLRRALRMADGRPPRTTSSGEAVRERAGKLTRATLAGLDDALTDLQGAFEGQPTDEEARELLAEARELRATLADQLADSGANGDEPVEGTDVAVDVDAELQSLKDDIDDISDGPADMDDE